MPIRCLAGGFQPRIARVRHLRKPSVDNGIDARTGGEWKTVYSDDLNILRLRKVEFDPVDADALRLVVTEAWGGGKAHVFSFDAR